MEKKTFAFKLADKRHASAAGGKWKARDGVALAGCSEVESNGDYRADLTSWPHGQPCPPDTGYHC